MPPVDLNDLHFCFSVNGGVPLKENPISNIIASFQEFGITVLTTSAQYNECDVE